MKSFWRISYCLLDTKKHYLLYLICQSGEGVAMNSFNEDPYVILGLLPGAAEKKIKKAYRRLAKRYHPDKNPDDPEAEKKFKQVQRAYERLSKDKNLKDVRTSVGQERKPSGDSADPFFSFFTALKSHYSKWKEGK